MIIILSDGSDVPSTSYNSKYAPLVKRAVENDIVVYTIGAGTSVSTSANSKNRILLPFIVIPPEVRKKHLLSQVLFWRRRRDSNSRDPYEAYTISSRARSTNYATSPSMAYRENDMQFWVSKKVVGLQGLEPGTVRL